MAAAGPVTRREHILAAAREVSPWRSRVQLTGRSGRIAAMQDGRKKSPDDADAPEAEDAVDVDSQPERPREIGGRGGLDPTRYGDWEKNGRCIDF
jgi:hypothetical protein